MQTNEIAEGSNNALLFLDVTGEVRYASPSCADVFGVLPADLTGQTTLHLIHPKDRKRSRRALQAVVSRPNRPYQIELRVRRGTKNWCVAEGIFINCLDVPPIGAIVVRCQDVGSRNSANARDRARTAALQRSVAHLEDCIDAVAHDLREPLRTISSFSSLLASETPLNSRASRIAQLIVDGVAGMAELLDGLYDYAAGQAPEFSKPIKPSLGIEPALRTGAAVPDESRYWVADQQSGCESVPAKEPQVERKPLSMRAANRG